jgi:ABC-type multidrug transport system fused ATPase/permease subunit
MKNKSPSTQDVPKLKLESKSSLNLLDEDSIFQGKFSKSIFETIAWSFRPFKLAVTLLLFMGLTGRLVLLGLANVFGIWADSFCVGNECPGVPIWMSGFQHQDFLFLLVAMLTFGFVLNTFFRVFISRVGSHAVSRLYDELTFHTSRLPISFFDSTPAGRIMTRFGSDYASIFRMAGGPLGEFLCLVFDLIAIALLAVLANVYFGFVILLLLVLNAVSYKIFNQRLRKERRELARSRSPSVALFSETYQGTRVIKSFKRESSFLSSFLKLVDLYTNQKVRTVAWIQGYASTMGFSTALVFLITGWFGLKALEAKEVTAGELAVVFTFILILSTTIQQFFEWLSNLEEAFTGVERMDQYLRTPIEAGVVKRENSYLKDLRARFVFSESHGSGRPSLAGSIRNESIALNHPAVAFRNVSLVYETTGVQVLQNISFSVALGQSLGVVGRTGSGKSSILQVLFGLYPIASGMVEILGEVMTKVYSKDDAIKFNVEELRRKIGFIPQEPTLIRGTVAENILGPLATSHAERQRLESILDEVGLSSRLFDRMKGTASLLEIEVSEQGANFSAGERQLMALARVMLMDCQVVVLDEATSAVDPETESLVMNTLSSKLMGKSKIIIAHRLETLNQCDVGLWIDQGSVKFQGTIEEVIARFKKGDVG